MKVRSARVSQYESIPFEVWKKAEFSLDTEVWTPDTSLSCNECYDIQDDDQSRDSILSFLIKFRASMMGDPNKPFSGSIQGYRFPEESEEFIYEASEAKKPRFESVRHSHFELKLTPDKVEELAANLFAKRDLWESFGIDTINNFLIAERHKSEWAALLKQSDRKKWKHHIRDYLKNKLLTEHCGALEKNDIKAAYDRDDVIVGKLIKDIHSLGGFLGPEAQEIRRALGNNFI